MSILSDAYLENLMGKGLIAEPDYSMVNPASIDIRVGSHVIVEAGHGITERSEIPEQGFILWPGQFVLLDTQERFRVPNGYAMDLRLKSSIARMGFNHSMAMWVDPGWEGVLTMEVQNLLKRNHLMVHKGMRFAQAVVHKLLGPSLRPYEGRYKGAGLVEPAKG